MLLLRKIYVFVVVVVVSSELPGGVSERLPRRGLKSKKKVLKTLAIYIEFVHEQIACQKYCLLQLIRACASVFTRRHASHFCFVEAKRSHMRRFIVNVQTFTLENFARNKSRVLSIVFCSQSGIPLIFFGSEKSTDFGEIGRLF